MNIEQALKQEVTSVRVSNGSKWLVWYEDQWTVFGKSNSAYAKKVKTILQTDNFEEALELLVK